MSGSAAANGSSARRSGCGKLYRARSRLYRNEILQVNIRLKALAEIYTMYSFALLESNLETVKSASGERCSSISILWQTFAKKLRNFAKR